jgi:hypothetical protein
MSIENSVHQSADAARMTSEVIAAPNPPPLAWPAMTEVAERPRIGALLRDWRLRRMVDRHWGLVAANRAVPLLIAGAAEHLTEPPVNVLRLSLHPAGMAPRIVNLGEWRAHLLDRLGRQAVVSGDPALFALHEELAAYPGGEGGCAGPRGRRDRGAAAPARRR